MHGNSCRECRVDARVAELRNGCVRLLAGVGHSVEKNRSRIANGNDSIERSFLPLSVLNPKTVGVGELNPNDVASRRTGADMGLDECVDVLRCELCAETQVDELGLRLDDGVSGNAGLLRKRDEILSQVVGLLLGHAGLRR